MNQNVEFELVTNINKKYNKHQQIEQIYNKLKICIQGMHIEQNIHTRDSFLTTIQNRIIKHVTNTVMQTWLENVSMFQTTKVLSEQIQQKGQRKITKYYQMI